MIITIDPGLSTGLACWNSRQWKTKVAPMYTELLRGVGKEKDEEWNIKFYARLLDFDEFLLQPGIKGLVDKVYCELPVLFQSPGSMASASSGALFKLVMLVGAYGGICYKHNIEFETVEVRKWKGQLPKSVVNRRIVRTLGAKACASFKADVWDAVGIGLYLKGLL